VLLEALFGAGGGGSSGGAKLSELVRRHKAVLCALTGGEVTAQLALLIAMEHYLAGERRCGISIALLA
jgi:hypothetical protein